MSAITVVYNQDISTLQVPDGVVIDVQTAYGVGAIQPARVSGVAYNGTAPWGPINAIGTPSDAGQLLMQYGPQGVGSSDLPTFGNLAFELGVTDVRLNRIGDGTQVAGILPVMAAAAAMHSLIGKYPGSAINSATATYQYSALTPAALMKTTGNTQKVLVDLIINIPLFGATETFLNLDGNVASTVGGVTSYAIDPIALGNAATAAINAGQPNGRGASSFFVSTPTTSPAPGLPQIGVPNVVTSLGTDGATFAAGAPLTLDAAMLGVAGSVSGVAATGMYAFAGNLSGAALSLCGCTDIATIAGPMLAFAKGQNGHAMVSFPNGTQYSGNGGAIALKNLIGIADYSISVFNGDFVEIIDSVNGAIHRFVDASPIACARYAITPPNISPANLEMNGVIVGTSRVGSLQQDPYGEDEVLALENAGINFFSNDTAADVGFAIAHNKNSLGKTAGYRGNMAYSHMMQFLIASYKSTLLGQLIGKDQGFKKPDDKSRSDARGLFLDFLGGLQDAEIISDKQVVCDLTNNSPGRGILRVDTVVEQNEIIDEIAVGLVSGVGVIASVTAVN